jgi:hypothetical protein
VQNVCSCRKNWARSLYPPKAWPSAHTSHRSWHRPTRAHPSRSFLKSCQAWCAVTLVCTSRVVPLHSPTASLMQAALNEAHPSSAFAAIIPLHDFQSDLPRELRLRE